MARIRRFDVVHLLVVLVILTLGAALLLGGCGGEIGTTTTTWSASPTGTTMAVTTGTTQATTGTTTVYPPDTGTGGSGSTEVTVPVGRPLTFVGPLSQAVLRQVRDIVMEAGADGQKVLDDVATLSAGDPVTVSDGDVDAFRGKGYSAGASTSQPVAVADVPNGGQVVLIAYTVSDRPDQTTVVAFELGTNLFVSKEGPLPIGPDTPNMTTTTSG